MSYLSVIPIGQPEAEQAYALVRAIAPEVAPDLWTAFVASCRPGELLGMRAPDGAVFGMASYRIEECAQPGRLMLVDNFVTLEVSRSAPVRATLGSALERTARECGCVEMRQVAGCRTWSASGDALRNHLSLADASPGGRAGVQPHRTALRQLSAAEMYPVW